MSDELFPVEIVQQDSPRLAWMKKHGVRTHHAKHLGPGETPWCAWFPHNGSGENREGIPINPDACGYGENEDEAIADLAAGYGVKLWNEESP